MKYAEFNNIGEIVAYYSDDIHAKEQIPSAVIELSDAEWSACVNNPGKWTYNKDYKKLVLNPAWSENVPALTLEHAKISKLTELSIAFETVSQNAHLMSSVGFEIDANETANRNISGLIISMQVTETERVSFCDFNNQFHDVTLSQLKTMQFEVISNAQALYASKWQLRELVNKAETIEVLNSIVIHFEV